MKEFRNIHCSSCLSIYMKGNPSLQLPFSFFSNTTKSLNISMFHKQKQKCIQLQCVFMMYTGQDCEKDEKIMKLLIIYNNSHNNKFPFNAVYNENLLLFNVISNNKMNNC